jgi:hypothetical protein
MTDPKNRHGDSLRWRYTRRKASHRGAKRVALRRRGSIRAGEHTQVDLLRHPARLLGAAPDYDIYPLAAMYQYIQEGYADRIVIGTDLWTRISTRRYGGYGMIRLLNFVVPTLRKYGVSQEHIDQITVHNPARLLAV